MLFNFWVPLFSVLGLWLVYPLQQWSSWPFSSPSVSFVIFSFPPNPAGLIMAYLSERQVGASLLFNQYISPKKSLHQLFGSQPGKWVRGPVTPAQPVLWVQRDSGNTSWAGNWTVTTRNQTQTSCSRGVLQLMPPVWKWKAPHRHDGGLKNGIWRQRRTTGTLTGVDVALSRMKVTYCSPLFSTQRATRKPTVWIVLKAAESVQRQL